MSTLAYMQCYHHQILQILQSHCCQLLRHAWHIGLRLQAQRPVQSPDTYALQKITSKIFSILSNI